MKVTKQFLNNELYPVDNSYSQDLTTGKYPDANNGWGLAGTIFQPPVLVKVISEPLTMEIWSDVHGHCITREFVIVVYNEKKFLILNCFEDLEDKIKG